MEKAKRTAFLIKDKFYSVRDEKVAGCTIIEDEAKEDVIDRFKRMEYEKTKRMLMEGSSNE